LERLGCLRPFDIAEFEELFPALPPDAVVADLDVATEVVAGMVVAAVEAAEFIGFPFGVPFGLRRRRCDFPVWVWPL
jgi:hypothetical protein